MSREVRRVPLDWKHPIVPNEHWREQQTWRKRRGGPKSRLHAEHERFHGLMSDYSGRLADWDRGGVELANRTGFEWRFALEYHLTGFKGHGDDEVTTHPLCLFADDNTEVAITVINEDHLHGLLMAKHATEAPNPADYMPEFEGDPEAFGWCLYETVSEGTPVTPVFATAEELIDHLATVGQDWGQEPMRRTSAEALVRSGFSLGTFVMAGGRLLDSVKDADVLAGAAPEGDPR